MADVTPLTGDERRLIVRTLLDEARKAGPMEMNPIDCGLAICLTVDRILAGRTTPTPVASATDTTGAGA